MIERFRQAGLIWPSLLAAAGLAILLSLGNWQMQRKVWKDGLQAQLAAAAQQDPVELSELLTSVPPEKARFRRVRVTGTFRHDLELHYWHPGDRGPAWAVLTPLVLSAPIPGADRGRGKRKGAPVTAILVDRGTVLNEQKAPEIRAAAQTPGEIEIVGRLRLGGAQGLFVSPPNFEKNEWYARDLQAMRTHLGNDRGAAELSRGLPRFFLEAETAAGGAGAPQPVLSQLSLSNRHLSYALTWYGLGGTLLAVFAAFAFGRLRRKPQQA